MFWSLFEQGKNCEARFAEPEKSATTRPTGKLRERPPIFPGPPTTATFFVKSAHKISERPGKMPFGISHAQFSDIPPIGMTSASEVATTRILVPIGSHVYVVRYISDDIVVKRDPVGMRSCASVFFGRDRLLPVRIRPVDIQLLDPNNPARASADAQEPGPTETFCTAEPIPYARRQPPGTHPHPNPPLPQHAH